MMEVNEVIMNNGSHTFAPTFYRRKQCKLHGYCVTAQIENQIKFIGKC